MCVDKHHSQELLTMEYKITLEWNEPRNIGCVFEYEGQEYLADIKWDYDKWCSEFAIFTSVDKQITFENAIPLYKCEDVEFSQSYLKECIENYLLGRY